MLSLPAAMVAMAISGAGSGQTVLLDFYADWCGPCRSMMPTVEQLSAKGYPVKRMNIDQNRELAQRFGITSIPCFVMIVNGREVSRVVGPTPLWRLEQLCALGVPQSAGNAAVAATAPPSINYASAANSANVCAVPPLTAPPASTNPMPQNYNAVASAPAVFAGARQPVSDATLLAASVRLRVEDPQGHSCGSGTIIDALPGGEALVVTCGHLFRDSNGQGKVEVDVFGPSPAAHVPGRVVSYDLERDVALVAFRPQGPVMVAHVAPRGYVIRPGDAVASVGCNNGEDPTVEHSQINALERFQDPVEIRLHHKIAEPHSPWNVEVAGQPVVGRSGGGLFSADGLVIGVCNAAEPTNREGLFAALGTIHTELDQQRLASLYQQPIAPPALVPATNRAADPRAMLAANDPFAARGTSPQVQVPAEQTPPLVSSNAPATVASTAGSTPPAAANRPAALSDSEQMALQEIHRKLREGSEIVCIIRDRNDPKSNSQVITLDRASPIFVNELARDAAGPVVTHPTALEVAKPREPILEWDSEAGWIHQNELPR